MYRTLVIVLVLMLAGLQFRLWVSDGSMAEMHRLKQTKQELKATIARARARNKALAAEIENLKSGTEAMAGRARSNIGMIKAGETFYLTLRSSEGSEAGAGQYLARSGQLGNK